MTVLEFVKVVLGAPRRNEAVRSLFFVASYRLGEGRYGMDQLILLVLFFIAAAISLKLRLKQIRQSSTVSQAKDPLAEAVAQLVAAAGGIYLSFLGLISFIKIDIPEKVSIALISFDPLAVLAIIISLLQPVFLKYFYKE